MAIQPRRCHSYFLFFIPLTQGVLLLTILDFAKNATNFGYQTQNLSTTKVVQGDDGSQRTIRRGKDPAYLAAQYAYAVWLMLMMTKAVIGFRANLKFNLRWMGRYNLLLGLDCIFEFVRTTVGVIFQDLSRMDEAALIRHYCLNYFILLLQFYGLFCCWIHLRWVNMEMPHLAAPTMPTESLLGLMFPIPARFTQQRTGSRVDVPASTSVSTGAGAAMTEATTAPASVNSASVISIPVAATTPATPAMGGHASGPV